MRQIPRAATLIAVLAACAPALAGDIYALNQNTTGFSLPGVSLPQGQDEVRAADGTTCRSAVSGSGTYLDMGVVGGNGATPGGIATYGRVVVPLGRKPPRLDCSKLYALEVERLQMEIRLLKMGLARGAEMRGGNPGWAQEGWSNGK
ncbi:MAG: hypothetical protein KF849_06720 [Rhizobiaceae bacterium]|nr:hypothetical protein [Rhizobiaceae bacterium]